ncbi:MAG: putative Ig domain-containing protein [Chloroflexi bacterium]|nr:putative Ig domain-containing protein [Chloroflexota bacterium]
MFLLALIFMLVPTPSANAMSGQPDHRGNSQSAAPALAPNAVYNVSTTVDRDIYGVCPLFDEFTAVLTFPNPFPSYNTGNLSLREALCIANYLGGTHTIHLPAGTYALTNTISTNYGWLYAGHVANSNITLIGDGATPQSTVIVGDGLDYVFALDVPVWNSGSSTYSDPSNISITFQNLSITGGNSFFASGAAITGGGFSGDTLTINTCIISNNIVEGDNGGAVSWVNPSTETGSVNIINSTFTNNTALEFTDGFDYWGGRGGAIYFRGGNATLNISGSTFSGNVATNSLGDGAGGAIYLGANSIAVASSITNSTFISNSASAPDVGLGGAILNYTGTLSIANSRITGNSAAGMGRGIFQITGTVGSVIATNNWWGCNAGPDNIGCDSAVSGTPGQITFNPWLVLALGASPNPVSPSSTTTVTANMTRNSSGGTGYSVPNGISVPWSTTLTGTFNPSTSTMSAGVATTFFTPTVVGFGTISTQVDNQPVQIPVSVTVAPSITSGNAATFTTGSTGLFTVTTTGFPTATLTVSGTKPGSIAFTDLGNGTATFSGTPITGDGAIYALTITAANGTLPNATQNFTLTINQPAGITSNNNVTFTVGSLGTFNVTRTGYPTPTLSRTGTLPGGVTFVTTTGVLSGTPLQDKGGLYPQTFTAHNGIGIDATQNFTLTVAETASITSTNTTTFQVGNPGMFSVTTRGYPKPSLTVSGTLPTGVSFLDNGNGTATLSGTPAASTGNAYNLTITAHNGIGADATQNFTLTVNEASGITSLNSTAFIVGQAGSFNVTTRGYPKPTLTKTGALPTGVSFVDNSNGTATLSGTPSSGTAGTYPFTITAHNGIGVDATQSFTLTVNQVAAITSNNSTTFTVSAVGSFNVTTTGTPTPAVSISGTLPTGVTFVHNGNGTATLGGTPSAGTGGVYSLSITAHNGIGADAVQTFTLTVNQAAAITSGNAVTFTVGSLGSFNVTKTGYPSPTLSRTGTLPGGVTFVTTTGVLSGTPAQDSGGLYPQTFTAHNGIGADATQNFALTVNEASAITSSNATTFIVGQAGTFNVTTRGYPKPTLTKTGALPTGVSFVDNGNGTATLSGTPSSSTAGTYPFNITAHNGVGVDATQSFTLTVNQAPAITSANNTTFTVGTAGSFTVTKTGLPTPTLSMTGSLPGGVTFNTTTGVLSGNPAVGSGNTFALTFSANNGIAPSATQNFTLTVNEASGVTSNNTTSFAVGQAGSFNVTTRGYPKPTLTISGTLPTGVSFLDNGNGTATLSGTPAAGTGNTYNLTITAHNGIGSDAVQSFTLTVNQSAAITSSNAVTFTVGSLGSFNVTKTGYPSPTLSRTGTLPGGVTFVTTTGVLSGTPVQDSGGLYPQTFNAHNGIGTDATQNFTLTVNEASGITSANSTTFVVGQSGSFSITTRGYPKPTLTKTGTLPTGITFVDNGNGTATLSGTPSAGTGGVYAITIGASNGVGVAASQNLTLTVNQVPAITSASTTTFTVGSLGSFTVTKTGYPAPTLSLSGTLPSGVTFNASTGTLSGTPAAGTGGSYPLTLTASNGILPNATHSFTLNVNQLPLITSANNVTFSENRAGTFSVMTSGYPKPAITYSGSLPGGVTLIDNNNGTATLGGTPNLGTVGTYNLTITATNSAGINAQIFALTVNQAPVITSANHATFTVGTFGSFNVTTTGTPTPSLSVSGTLPTGVTFNTGTGVLSGTPASGTDGVYNLTFTAHNTSSPDAIQSFTLTINQAAAITSTNAVTFTVGSSGLFTVTTTGYPKPSLSVSGTLPAGITFTDNGNGTGKFSGTPTSNGTFNVTITASNGVGANATQNFVITTKRVYILNLPLVTK